MGGVTGVGGAPSVGEVAGMGGGPNVGGSAGMGGTAGVEFLRCASSPTSVLRSLKLLPTKQTFFYPVKDA